MIIIGSNIGLRPSGQIVRDTGACLIENGEVIVAIAEERITRKKHDSTINNSIDYCLFASGHQLSDVDLFVFSICGSLTPSVDYVWQYLSNVGLKIPKDKIVICPSHHLSHASSAFYSSGLQESLILVADHDGSIIDGNEKEVYANSVEHISYYSGNDLKLELLERDDDLFGDIGVGLGYSYVTEWLGFDGLTMAGKTMALAAYGESGALSPAHFYQIKDNKIHCLLEPTNDNKSLSVRRLIYKATGEDVGAHCVDTSSRNARNIARLIQDDLEYVVIEKLKYLKEKTGLKNLCFAGGVALNCRLNYLIHKANLFENIFIQPAAGDTGQCLGNALYGYHEIMHFPRKYIMHNVYLGRQYSSDEIAQALNLYKTEITIHEPDKIYEQVADYLLNDKIIGWFQDKSEFGPRALGNRSILASPLNPIMRDMLNEKVKHREWFRPFGVSVMSEFASDFFDFIQESPYMLIAPQTHQEMRPIIPSAVHVDGSCRLQTVNLRTNNKLYSLLQAFMHKCSIPILINTSFNDNGEPIVETPKDAIRCFLRTKIDYLVLDKYLISKK